MIYVLEEAGDHTHIKIGYAKSRDERVDIEMALRRAASFQTGNRRDLLIVGAQDGDGARERELHRMFRITRVAGEWFGVSPDVEAWLRLVRLDAPVRVRRHGRRDIDHGTMPLSPDRRAGITRHLDKIADASRAIGSRMGKRKRSSARCWWPTDTQPANETVPIRTVAAIALPHVECSYCSALTSGACYCRKPTPYERTRVRASDEWSEADGTRFRIAGRAK